MTFPGILPPLLFSLVFLLPAWWLYRTDRKVWAGVPALTFLVLFVYTIVIYLEAINHTQAEYDLDLLLTELERPDLWESGDLRDDEETLFLASMGSQALFRAGEVFPERRADITTVLIRLAQWVTEPDHFRQWQRRSNWDREMYFVAHAGIILGHYQLVTGREDYAEEFQRIGEYLGNRLKRGRYKHLYSRDSEDLLRPADNAAAIYALTLYDQYYGENYAPGTRSEWAGYIQRELYYAESRLPCAAFTETNRCRIEPSAVATGLYISYRAAAAPEEAQTDIPYQEWLHYFKRGSGNPFGLSIRPNMRRGEEARLCEEGILPLDCEYYENAVGLWAAAEYGGGYTFFRLFSGMVLERWFGAAPDYLGLRPSRRVKALIRVALRAVGQLHQD